MRRARARSAFTLTELLVVIGIIAMLTLMTLPVLSPLIKGKALDGSVSRLQGAIFKTRSLAAKANANYYLSFNTLTTNQRHRMEIYYGNVNTNGNLPYEFWAEAGDEDNQLSGYEMITGIDLDTETDTNGAVYFVITEPSAGTYQVNVYKDSDATTLIAHASSTYTAADIPRDGNGLTRNLTADNSSGVGGSIDVDAAVGPTPAGKPIRIFPSLVDEPILLEEGTKFAETDFTGNSFEDYIPQGSSANGKHGNQRYLVFTGSGQVYGHRDADPNPEEGFPVDIAGSFTIRIRDENDDDMEHRRITILKYTGEMEVTSVDATP